jgi:hypothetical protein
MTDRLKSYRIKYEVHCRLENFFGKEIVVKNCYSEVQAKYKLGAYCEKKYGVEFECVKFISVTEETFEGLFNNIFGNDIFDNKSDKNDIFGDILKNLKNKKK